MFTYSSGYGIAKELGMNRLVVVDASEAFMRLSCEVATDVAVMPKAHMTVWMLCSCKNEVSASMSL